jgi:hypothetical protein
MLVIRHTTGLFSLNKSDNSKTALFEISFSYNGGVYAVREKKGIYSGQIKALTAKLTRSKYRPPLPCLDGDIQFFRYLPRMIDVHNRKFYSNSCFFFRDGWIELVKLHYKKCFKLEKNVL